MKTKLPYETMYFDISHEVMITSLKEMLDLPNCGHMVTYTV